MKIGIVYGLSCPRTSFAGGLAVYATQLRKLGHDVSIYEWGDKLPIGLQIVIGHSFGGETAIKYGNANPDCVVIALDPVPQNWFPFFWRLHAFTCTAKRIFLFLCDHGGFPSQQIKGVQAVVLPRGITHNSLRGDKDLQDKITQIIQGIAA